VLLGVGVVDWSIGIENMEGGLNHVLISATVGGLLLNLHM
jgi:hypothetical protein